MPAELSVAIIGLGSRGLSVLERVIALAPSGGTDSDSADSDSAGLVRVDVIDPTAAGAGVHGPQPDYLLLNTTCAQVSMFPDACTVGDEQPAAGPSLYEWVREQDLRIAGDGFTVGPIGRQIRPTDFLPRRLLGQYLEWFLNRLRAERPVRVILTLHRAQALDLSSLPDDRLRITLSDGTVIDSDCAFLTTGYTPNLSAGSDLPGAERRIDQPYPLPAALERIGAGETVAIGGFGLSAMDVMSCLTVGRGGRFVEDGDRLRYLASGREPSLLFYSRSGVPCRARPLVVEFGDRYQPLVFTRAAIDDLRSARDEPLDFHRDVWSLVLTELRIAYRRAEARAAGAPAEAALAAALSPNAGRGRIELALADLDVRLGRFDPSAVLDGSSAMQLESSQDYQRWLAELVSADLVEGVLGFASSPLKGALDMLRDLRDTFRYVVDFGGLSPASLDSFVCSVVPTLNRAVVGPQYERHLELLALMAAGVVSVPFGPAPSTRWNCETGRWQLSSSRLAQPHSQQVDWLVSAWVEPPAVERSASPLLSSLSSKGCIRAHRPDSRFVLGIDIDADQHPIDVHGRPDRRLWVLGPLCEGANFYTNLVPSPACYSRPIHDAHRCVRQLYESARVLSSSR